MKKAIKRIISCALCASMLISVATTANAEVGTEADSETDIETDCAGNCKHSPVIVLPGINHSPTYLYDENDQPVMNDDTHIGGTLLILNEAALTTEAIIKAAVSILGTITLQMNVGLDKVAYDLVAELFK